MVAMGYLGAQLLTTRRIPVDQAVPRKLPVTLSAEQVSRLLDEPDTDTVIGLRDRACSQCFTVLASALPSVLHFAAVK